MNATVNKSGIEGTYTARGKQQVHQFAKGDSIDVKDEYPTLSVVVAKTRHGVRQIVVPAVHFYKTGGSFAVPGSAKLNANATVNKDGIEGRYITHGQHHIHHFRIGERIEVVEELPNFTVVIANTAHGERQMNVPAKNFYTKD